MDDVAANTRDLSFLDVLLALAENWLVIIVGAIAVSAVVYFGLDLASPSVYQASTTIRLPPAITKLDAARTALLSLADDPTLAPIFGSMEPEERRAALRQAIQVDAGPAPNTVVVTASYSSANAADRIAAEVTRRLQQLAATNDEELAALKLKIDANSRLLASLQAAGTAVRESFGKNQTAQDPESYVRATAAIEGDIQQAALSLGDLQSQLNDWPDGQIAETNSAKALPQRKVVLAASAGLVALFLLTALVLIRDRLRHAALDPVAAGKILRIRRAFWPWAK